MALIVALVLDLAFIGASCFDSGVHWGSSGVSQVGAPAPTMAYIGALAPLFAFIGDPSGVLAPNLDLIRALTPISAFIGDPAGWLKL